MGIIQGIKDYKYRYVLSLLKKKEVYDKRKSVINGEEAFKRCYERYALIQDILLPLKEKLGDRIDVTDIYFTNCRQEENGIIVKYLKDDRQYILAISNLDFETISIVSSDDMVKKYDFIEANKDIILHAFKDIDNNSLDEEVIVNSTSNKFVIKDNCDSFSIRDKESNFFQIEKKYSQYVKDGDLYMPSNIICNYPRLKEILISGENIKLIYQNLSIYDEDIEKVAQKKLTYS